MVRARGEDGSVRWLVLGLSIHGVAAALVLTNVLCSSSARAPTEGAPNTPAAVEASVPAPTPRAPESARREPQELRPDELELRVRDATVALALALEAPELEDADWRAAVQDQVRTLGTDALPALNALLADDSRSVEEHVAANELLAQLSAR